MSKKSSAKPWETRWQKRDEEKLGGGGQGTTYVVLDLTGGPLGVLKIQNFGKTQSDPERRGRFRREATALETLNHPRIPKLLDTNAEQHRDVKVDLFMVQEHIDGTNLEGYIGKNGPMGTTLANEMTRALLDVLAYCHDQEVGHRDVKPDNIVLRLGSPADPVLVDFGQSFPADPAADSMATADEQIMGNHFFRLPEHVSGHEKRDIRSDLTMLAGVLFYAVTGISPRQLRDANGLPPHRRPNAGAALATVERAELLLWFFDTAFGHRSVERFQTAHDFGEALKYVDGGAVLPLSAILAAGNIKLGGAADIKARENFPQFRDALVQLAKDAAKAVNLEMKGARTYTISGMVDTAVLRESWNVDFGIGVVDKPSLRVISHLWVFLEDATFAVRMSPPNDGPHFDTSVFAPVIPPDFGDRLASTLATLFAKVLFEEG